MTSKLYEIEAKGDLKPETSPNSTCKTWHLISALYFTESAKAAQSAFEKSYAGEYSEIVGVKELKPDHPTYKAYMESNPGLLGGVPSESRA